MTFYWLMINLSLEKICIMIHMVRLMVLYHLWALECLWAVMS